MDAFEVLKLSFERHLTLDIQSPFRKLPEIITASLEKFSMKYIKNESSKSYKVDFDMLKSMGFGNLVGLLSSLRRFDRVYQG